MSGAAAGERAFQRGIAFAAHQAAQLLSKGTVAKASKT